MAKNTIDTKTLKFFPQLNKSTKWSDVWEQCLDSSFEVGVYDKIIPDTRPSQHQLDITLYKVTDEQTGNIIHKFEISGDERDKYIPYLGDFNVEAIYKLCIEFLIGNKYIKKPKNSSQIQAQKANELEDLRKQKHRITMKMWAWKKQGRDISELEIQKVQIINQIKQL